MKKFLSLLLTLSCVFAFTIPAFAAENTSDSSFENDVIFAEVSDGSIQEYSASNIIVMTPDQVLELGTEIPSIVETSKMVYINGEIDAASLSSCGIDVTVTSVNHNEQYNPNVGTALVYQNGEILLNEISILAENPISIMSERSNKLVYDSIETALNTDYSDPQGVLRYPDGYQHRANKSATVYDTSNNNIGSISFVDYFYEKGQWTDGYLFDTVCRATFAPNNGYKCTKFYVSLGVNDSNFPAHEIIDQTRIGSNGSSTTHSLELSGSKEGISGGGSTSWSYDVDAQDVQNAFSETDVKTWRFSPKSAANGDAWMEEPGIRSVSTSKTNCFTRTTLKCPFTTIFDIELKENTLDYSIYFTYGS